METREARFAGVAGLILAALYVAAAVIYILLPEAQRLGVRAPTLLPSFAEDPMLLQAETLVLAAMGVVGLAVVGPIRTMVGPDAPWVRWASYLALIGFAVAAVGNTLVLAKLPGIASAYVAADASAQQAIAAFWRTTLDPWGLWQFGAIGLWTVVVGLVALRRGGLPQIGIALALAGGIAQLAIPLALFVSATAPFAIIAIVAGIVAASWFAWVGMHLRAGAGSTPG
jgi:hypothetical protein